MGNPLNVLVVGYEASPFYKRGGLGDVVSSLPKALYTVGVDARVVIPYYNSIESEYKEKRIGEFSVVFGSKIEIVTVYSSFLAKTKIPIYFLQNKKHLASINLRGRNKKIDQFAFFDLCVVEFAFWLDEHKKWCPSLIHCNDWQTALIPLLMQKRIPTLLTIHNLNYQGKGSLKVLDLLHIKDKDAKELRRGIPATEINLLGEGIIHTTQVSTVSPSYAQEITSDYDNDPIHNFIVRREKERGKKDQVWGILNGIDYDIWNPKIDEKIAFKYDEATWEIGKKENKKDLLKQFSLENRLTFCFVGRMATQKGLDLLLETVDDIVSQNVNIIILGSGLKSIEKSISRAAKKYPLHMRVKLTYSEELAHQFYAASDFILIPSRYEPCGLIQMIAMRYGTLPIASVTGGLKDSIKDGYNGFLFKNGSASELLHAIKKAVELYNKPQEYRVMVKRAIEKDFSWETSSLLYKKLYIDTINSY